MKTPAHHITGATAVHLNSGRLSNTKLSSADSNNSLSSSTEHDDESYKLIAVQQTAGENKIKRIVKHVEDIFWNYNHTIDACDLEKILNRILLYNLYITVFATNNHHWFNYFHIMMLMGWHRYLK